MEDQFQAKEEADENGVLKFASEELNLKPEIQQQQSEEDEEMLLVPLNDKGTEPSLVLDEVLDVASIAKRQLEILNTKERKPRKQNISNTEKQITVKSDNGGEASYILSSLNDESETITRVEPLKIPHISNLSSSILSKAEFNNVIMSKVVRNDSIRVSSTSRHEEFVGTIEIPQELILSQEMSTPGKIVLNESQPQLQSQELIDILEGNETDHTETYEIVDQANNNVDHVVEGDYENYEILEELDITEDTKKLTEREIALNQIRNLPVKNRGKAKSQGTTRKMPQKNLVQTLVSEWSDDEKDDSDNGTVSSTTVTYELMKNQAGPSKTGGPIILNQLILNKQPEAKEPKNSIKILNMEVLSKDQEFKVDMKKEVKILNKEAPISSNSGFINQAVMNKIKSKLSEPKILNKLAPKADEPPMKTSRVIKRKTIWDPSDRSLPTPDNKPKLPAGITIKKITGLVKPELTPVKIPDVDLIPLKEETEGPIAKISVVTNKKPTKKKSEIEKLLGDEGAINMLNSLENPAPIPEQPEAVAEKSPEKPKKLVREKTPKPKKTSPVVPATKKQKPPPVDISKAQKKTPAKKKKSDTGWDYVYNNQCDDSMIIRRRSNSSYSSSAPTSPRRLSLDLTASGSVEGKSSASIDGTFEFKQPPGKVTQSPADEILTPNLIAEMKGKMKKVINKVQNKKVEKEVVFKESAKKRAASVGADEPVNKASRVSERKSNSGEYKEIQLKRLDGYVELVLLPQERGDLNVLSNEVSYLINQKEFTLIKWYLF